MPDRQRVDAFVAAVVSGDHVRAIADFYHEDASMREPDKPPRRGRDLLIGHERAALARLARMETHPPRFVVVEGDNVAIQWTFDAIGRDGSVRRLEEVAIQRWSGDRIVEERFFYDTASAWRTPPT
jgi:ketosteroid isomerase-like protein